jgi:hypothetical protein
MTEIPRGRPSLVWAHALDYLARRDAERLSEFFRKTALYLTEEREALFARGDQLGEDSEDLDFFLDERDELDGFLQDNRYFTIVRAWGNFERVRDRIILCAVHYQILPEGRFMKNDMVFPRAVWDALDLLGIGFKDDDKTALDVLRERRNKIVHQNGMVKRKNSGDPDQVEALEFSDNDVKEFIALSLRMARHILESFKLAHCGESS